MHSHILLLHLIIIFFFLLLFFNPSNSSSSVLVIILAVIVMLTSLKSHDPSSSSADHSRQLLISCAELIHHSDFPAARRIASLLLSAQWPVQSPTITATTTTTTTASSSTTTTTTSPLQLGDSTDRVVHQFTLALSLRLSLLPPPPIDPNAVQSSYLSLNQITPFVRFAHLTANQAILEALQGSNAIHILDFDTSHGLQWPPLLQAIAARSDPSNPPSVRITGTGSDLSVLRRTSHRLQTFAASLGLPFHFHPILLPLPNSSSSSSSSSSAGNDMNTRINRSSSSFALQLHPGETLAVNCVMFLSKLMKDRDPFDADGSREVQTFLRATRAMNPAVVTVAEREASHNSPVFLQRFMEALEHYTSVFESLEATLPPANRERLAVEQVWFGREIADIVAGEGEGRRERSQRFERWEALMTSAGFGSRAVSPFALSQARLLLRLHYPSEGYMLKMVRDSLFLGWQNKPLFSVSSWN